MQQLAKVGKQILQTPLAGLYTSLLVLLLAFFTGERDLIGLLLSKMFPAEGSVAVTVTPLDNLADSHRDPAGASSRVLMLALNSDSKTLDLSLVQTAPGTRVPEAVSSIGGTVAYHTIIPDRSSRPVAEIRLPSGTVLGLIARAPTGQVASDEELVLVGERFNKQFSRPGDLLFLSRNDLSAIRGIYAVIALLIAAIGITAPWFRVRFFETEDEAAD